MGYNLLNAKKHEVLFSCFSVFQNPLPTTKPEISRDQMFEACLRNTILLADLQVFSRRAQSVESILFYRSIQNFRKNPTIEEAKRLVADFVDDGPNQVNVPASVAEQVRSALSDCENMSTMFDKVEKVILELIFFGIFRDWTKQRGSFFHKAEFVLLDGKVEAKIQENQWIRARCSISYKSLLVMKRSGLLSIPFSSIKSIQLLENHLFALQLLFEENGKEVEHCIGFCSERNLNFALRVILPLLPNNPTVPCPLPFESRSHSTLPPVFGENLRDILIRDGEQIPQVVVWCIDYLYACDAHTEESIFSVSGSKYKVDEIKASFDAAVQGGITSEFDDPHCVASVLKQFFNELAEPMFKSITRDIVAMNEFSNTEKEQVWRQIITKLNPETQWLLAYVLDYWWFISQYSSVNKMKADNLATVFSPSLLRSTDMNSEEMQSLLTLGPKALRVLIEGYKRIKPYLMQSELQMCSGDENAELVCL
eukprot:Lithocolla_globosa_v1_NODE_2184_length_2121_cov_4.802517.p1 type:complete len:481 gc:universal NODE_2184_length_2121_cov_4.802517:1502-60(-)